MSANELIHRLGTQLAADPEVAAEGWQHLALVGMVDAEQSRISGFAYSASGKPEPAAPSNLDALDTLEELRGAMVRADGKGPWKSCLVRIDRESGKITVDFEYDDAGRWAITRANSQQRARELQPL